MASVANGDEIGDYFQYSIDQKVTLPRQKSAMLPIVNQPVEGARVSIYNEARSGQIPAAGPALQEHDRPGPDAGAGGGVRRRHLRRRRPHHGPSAQRGAAA